MVVVVVDCVGGGGGGGHGDGDGGGGDSDCDGGGGGEVIERRDEGGGATLEGGADVPRDAGRRCCTAGNGVVSRRTLGL